MSNDDDQCAATSLRARGAMWGLNDGRCVACTVALDPFGTGPSSLQVDHVVPRSQGGPDALHNYQPLCRECNANKGARHATDWRSKKQADIHPEPAIVAARRHEAQDKREAFVREFLTRKYDECADRLSSYWESVQPVADSPLGYTTNLHILRQFANDVRPATVCSVSVLIEQLDDYSGRLHKLWSNGDDLRRARWAGAHPVKAWLGRSVPADWLPTGWWSTADKPKLEPPRLVPPTLDDTVAEGEHTVTDALAALGKPVGDRPQDSGIGAQF
jgi:hypothetical protein